MTRTDSIVVGTLVVLLAVIAGIVTVPSMLTTAVAGDSSAAPSPSILADRPYREGVLGHPDSVSPFSSRTQADRDLVALVFAGLVRNGPGGSLVADLADHWSADSTGSIWTFHLRDDAVWHDGQRVTADDVAFTIKTLQDPDYMGPGARSWEGVKVETDGLHTVTFTLATPLGGFLQAATQPIAPAHLLADIPVDQLADAPFGRLPVGSGPFQVVRLEDPIAELLPASATAPADDPTPAPTATGLDPSVTASPSTRPTRPSPYLSGIEFRFFDDPEELAAAYRAGEVDAASGLSPEVTRDLSLASDSRAIHYPGATLTAVLLNLRPGHPEFADADVRRALLQAIDRPTLVSETFAAAAEVAAGLIPPSSWLFDETSEPPIAYDRGGAVAALKKAGWTRDSDGWHLPNAKDPVKIELISTDEASNPAAYETAEAVADAWTALGLGVEHVSLPPSEFGKDRLATGKFGAAIADVTIGLDPDLYPLLASSQTLSGGSNVLGLQDPKLDGLLSAARKPAGVEDRKTAYVALQKAVRAGQYLLPLAFADESVVVRDTVTGPSTRQVADPADRFWDVLTWRLAAGR